MFRAVLLNAFASRSTTVTVFSRIALAAGYWRLQVDFLRVIVLACFVRLLPLFCHREIFVAIDAAALVLSHAIHGNTYSHAACLLELEAI